MSTDPLFELEYRCWYLAENLDRPRLTRAMKKELREEAKAAGRAVDAVRAQLRDITGEVEVMKGLVERIAVAVGAEPQRPLLSVVREGGNDDA